MKKSIHRIGSALKTPDYIRILMLRTIGNFLILGSLFLIAKTFYLPVREEIKYFVDRLGQREYVVVKDEEEKEIQKGLLAQELNLEKTSFLIPADPEFSVVIPKIGANSKVLANIDAANEELYLSALNNGVAHALGTAFPGEGGHVYLFAHSTDYLWNVGSYNAVFYLLNKLDKGDEIDLFFKGQRHLYKVVNSTVVDPSQVDYLTRKSNKELLTLQTCWPPGTTLKRLLVFATRVVE